jgi:hypothetical protein
MPVDSPVNVGQELLTLLDQDASLQDLCLATFVQILPDQDKRFRSTGEPSGFCLVGRRLTLRSHFRCSLQSAVGLGSGPGPSSSSIAPTADESCSDP